MMIVAEQDAARSLILRTLLASSIFIALQRVACNRRNGRLDAGRLLVGAIAGEPDGETKDAYECEVFADYGKNYLTPVDVLVKAIEGEPEMTCIKARFALSVRVEEKFVLPSRPVDGNSTDEQQIISTVLGYLPLERVLAVENSCPSKEPPKNESSSEGAGANGATESEQAADDGQAPNGDQAPKGMEGRAEGAIDELEMIVTFDCGKLAFKFVRDQERIFVSSIRGVVKLDRKVVVEFVSTKRTFLTSDLDHHFRYDDIIEIDSEADVKTYHLKANFYFTEIEAFRETKSQDFVKPPDKRSQPYSDETQPEIEPGLVQKGQQGQGPRQLSPAAVAGS